MRTKAIAQDRRISGYEKRVISICFDEQSLQRIAPGLKLVFAAEEPPVFFNVTEKVMLPHG